MMQRDTPNEALTVHVRRLLWMEWDPIGAAALGAPDDEYYCYVPGIVALVQDTRVYEQIITDHLTRIERDEMCINHPVPTTQRTARALLGLREAYRRSPFEFIDQILSRNGLHCAWIFRREGDLFHYEYATLCEETDANGTLTWWSGPEQGRSGLFEDAIAAESEARASLRWLQDLDEA